MPMQSMPSSSFVDWRLNRKAQVLSNTGLALCRSHPLLADLYVRVTGHITRGLGHHFERETIDEFILLYCVEGQGWLRLAGQEHVVQPQQLVVVPRGHAHGYGAHNADPWTIHWAHFDGSQVAAFLELMDHSAQRPILTLQRAHWLDLPPLFNAMLALLSGDPSPAHVLKAASCLRQILSTAALDRATRCLHPAPESAVDRVIQLMHRNITQNLQLEEMAAHVDLSSSHLHRLFRSQTGTAPINFFMRLKIQRACELLDNTEMKINEIGHFLGYSDPHYFSRIFKQITGHAPRQFRALRRAGKKLAYPPISGADYDPHRS
jgi:AraC family transcriptional regulator, arabinose operon regulatory protein